MGAYMYPIIIKREPQKIRYNRQIELTNDGVFTLSELSKLVNEEEKFSIIEIGQSIYCSHVLSISGERMETEKEVSERVAKEENYMKNYTEFHNNKTNLKQ